MSQRPSAIYRHLFPTRLSLRNCCRGWHPPCFLPSYVKRHRSKPSRAPPLRRRSPPALLVLERAQLMDRHEQWLGTAFSALDGGMILEKSAASFAMIAGRVANGTLTGGHTTGQPRHRICGTAAGAVLGQFKRLRLTYVNPRRGFSQRCLSTGGAGISGTPIRRGVRWQEAFGTIRDSAAFFGTWFRSTGRLDHHVQVPLAADRPKQPIPAGKHSKHGISGAGSSSLRNRGSATPLDVNPGKHALRRPQETQDCTADQLKYRCVPASSALRTFELPGTCVGRRAVICRAVPDQAFSGAAHLRDSRYRLRPWRSTA